MNFFGHVVVASWRDARAAVALGAMLPDLAAMAGIRPARIGRKDVERGIDLHHATDGSFHRLASFAALCGETSGALRARGLSRGPARAAAHVGVELALDGFLVTDRRAAALYVAALDDRPAAESIACERDAHRFRELLDHLARRGVPEGYRDPVSLTRAVARALARRPRLALDGEGAAMVEAEMPAIRARVERAAPALLGDLRASLDR